MNHISKKAPEPVGPYPHAKRVGDFIFVSGIGPRAWPDVGRAPARSAWPAVTALTAPGTARVWTGMVMRLLLPWGRVRRGGGRAASQP